MNCILFSIIETSGAHQYAVPKFWGTCEECDAELAKREAATGRFLGWKVARIEDYHRYTY